MLKPIQLLFKVSFLLVIAIVIAIICAMIFIDPNAYKADISHLVYKYTSRELNINGKIKWSLTPQVTLGIQDITLNNTSDFTGPLLKAAEANIKLSLIDLLKKKIVIKGLGLQNPEIYLVKTKNGHTNFDDLLSPKKPKVVAAQISQSSPESQGSKIKSHGKQKPKENFPPITIDELNIKNGKIQWQDIASNKNILLHNLNISSKDLTLDFVNKLAPILISGKIKDLSNNFKEITFSSTLIANLATQTFKIEPLQVKLAKINATGNLLVKIADNVINIDPINIDILDSKHQASIIIDLKEAIPTISIKNKTNTFAIEKLLTELAQFKKLHGNTNITAALKARGTQPAMLKKSLHGTIEINMQQGTFDGFDVHKLLKQAETTLNGLFNAIKNKEHASIPSLLSSQVKDWKSNQGADAKTIFDVLHAKVSFQNGISKDTSFTIQHSDYGINGHGEINLVTETVNLQIQATYKGVDQGKNSNVTNYMLNTPLIIWVQGRLYEPEIKPDLNSYCKDALETAEKKLLKSVIKKTINKLISKAIPNNNDEQQNNPLKNIEKNLLNKLFKEKE